MGSVIRAQLNSGQCVMYMSKAAKLQVAEEEIYVYHPIFNRHIFRAKHVACCHAMLAWCASLRVSWPTVLCRLLHTLLIPSWNEAKLHDVDGLQVRELAKIGEGGFSCIWSLSITCGNCHDLGGNDFWTSFRCWRSGAEEGGFDYRSRARR